MSLRQEMLPQFDWIIDTVLEIKEKNFFEEYPTVKDAYKRFKKELGEFRYVSDDPVYQHEKKNGLKIWITRPEVEIIPLLKQYNALYPIVKQAIKEKHRKDERAQFLKKREKFMKQLEAGKIDKTTFLMLERRRFKDPTPEEMTTLIGGY